MPRIPTLAGQRVAPRATAAPFLRHSGDTGAGAIARGIGAAAKAIEQDTLQRQAKINRAQVNEAIAALGTAQLGLTHGFDKSPGAAGPPTAMSQMPSVNTQKGKNAAGVSMRTMQAYDDELDRLSVLLANDPQRAAFGERSAASRQQFNIQLQRYENGQIEQAVLDAHNANKAKGLELAIENRGGVADFDAQAALTLDAIKTRGAEDGDEDETIEAEMADFMSKAAAGAIMGNIQDKTVGQDGQLLARTFFDTFKEHLSDSDGTLAKVQRALDVAEEDFDHSSEVRRIAGIAGLQTGRRVDDDQWNAILDEVARSPLLRNNARLRARVTAELQSNAIDIDKGVDLELDEVHDAEWRRIDGGGRYADMDATVKAQLTTADLSNLYALDQQRQSPKKAGKVVTNQNALRVAEDLAENNPQLFVDINFNRMSENFEPRHLESLRAKQRSIRAVLNGEPDTTQISRLDQMMRAEMSGMEADDQDIVGRRLNEARLLLNERRKELGKDLTVEQMQEVMDDVLVEVNVRRWFRDDTVFAGDLLDEDEAKAYVDIEGITPGDRKITGDYLRSVQKIDPDDAAIEHAYSMMILGRNPGLSQAVDDAAARREANFAPSLERARQRSQETAEDIFGQFNVTMTPEEESRARLAIERGGREPTKEGIQQAHIMLTVDDRLKLGDEVIPSDVRVRANRRRDAVTGKPIGLAPGATVAERTYFILLDIGLDDDEARRRSGLGPRQDNLGADDILPVEGDE